MAQISLKKKPIGKMFVMGVISLALYAALLQKQSLVTSIFTRGGMYALLPIAAALTFSFVHGSFTSYFWSVMGIEAARKKKEVR